MYRHGVKAKRNLVILSVLLLGALLASACRPVTAPPAGTAPELDAATSAKVDALVEAQMKELGVPGVAVGIVKDGALVYAKGFGVTHRDGGMPVTPATFFQLASIAKTFTSTAILQLVEQGKVELDAPVTKYLPYFALADGREGEITVRHLLTHTSGLPDNSWTDMSPYLEARDDEMALEDHVRSAREVSLLFDPGTKFEYTSFGYDVLGDIVAKVSGQPFEEYVAEHVFTPLGMDHSTLLLGDVDLHLIGEGRHLRLWDVLGAHATDGGCRFAVWAPNARAVRSACLRSPLVKMNLRPGNSRIAAPSTGSGVTHE